MNQHQTRKAPTIIHNSGAKKTGNGIKEQEKIYLSISDAITGQRLRPGTKLREDALASVFGVSRTGIRQILQRLAVEQLITLTPRRGASVTRPTTDEARDVFDARQIVECGLMSEISNRINNEDIKALRRLAAHERKALHSDERSSAIKFSAAFHVQLAAISGNSVLADFVDGLCSRTSLILSMYGSRGHLGCESHDHNGLIDLLEEGQIYKAKDFMLNHLKAIEASLVIREAEDELPDLNEIFADSNN